MTSTPPADELRTRALQALLEPDPQQKVALAQLGFNYELRNYQCEKVSRSGIRCDDLPTYHSQI